MASLKNRRGMWYARVQWYEENQRKEKQIPLKTESKVTARQRLTMVNQVEDEIIELHYKGEKYSFPITLLSHPSYDSIPKTGMNMKW